MKKTGCSIAMSLMLCLASHAHALDARATDLAGVRLYMTPPQVIDAIIGHFGPSQSISIKKTDRTLSPGKMYDSILLKSSIYNISIFFVEIAPNKEVVYEVRLGFNEGEAKPENIEELFASMVKKYGPPTTTYKKDRNSSYFGESIDLPRAAWCNESVGGECTPDHAALYFLDIAGIELFAERSMLSAASKYIDDHEGPHKPPPL